MEYYNGSWTPVVMMVAISFANGMANVLVKKTLDGGINHMIVATYRLAISTVFLIPIAYFWERKTRPRLTASILLQLFFSALLGASLTQYFFLLGLAYTSATMSCAAVGTIPALTFMLALIFRMEKLKLKSIGGVGKVVGTVICIVGALVLTFYKGIQLTHPDSHSNTNSPIASKKTENWVLGAILLFAGSMFFASWLLVQAKINKSYPCQYSSTVILSFFGTIQCAMLSLVHERNISAWILKDKFDILTIAYAGMVAQGLCTVGFSWCIKMRGPVFTSTFTPLTLIFVMIIDFSFLHGIIFVGSVIGSIIIVSGLYIFLWGKTKDENNGTKLLPEVAECKETEVEEEDYSKTIRPVLIPMTP